MLEGGELKMHKESMRLMTYFRDTYLKKDMSILDIGSRKKIEVIKDKVDTLGVGAK